MNQATCWRRSIYEPLFTAAGHLFEAIVGGDEPAAIERLRERIRQDVRLDEMRFVGEERAESLDMACGWPVLFKLDLGDYCVSAIGVLTTAAAQAGEPLADDVLQAACGWALIDQEIEEHCLSALEKLARDAAESREPIPDRVLRMVSATVDRLRRRACNAHGLCVAGETTETPEVMRLRALLEDHPGLGASSEHIRVHADAFLGGPEYIDALRAAVALDQGNLRAKCALTETLARRGELDEAAALYAGLADPSAGPPCDLGAIRRLLDGEVEPARFRWMDRQGREVDVTD